MRSLPSLRPCAFLAFAVVVVAIAVFTWRQVRSGSLGEPTRAPPSINGAPVSVGNPTSAGKNASGGGQAGVGGAHRLEWAVDEVSPPVEFAGRVLVDGRPTSGITVTLTDELTTEGVLPVLRTTTGDDGRFAFAPTKRVRGSYRVAAFGEGVSSGWNVLPGGASKRDIDLRLQTCRVFPYGVVSDASGGAVAGARVFLAEVPEAAVVSAADGSFKLCMAPGTGTLRVVADGYGLWSKKVSATGSMRQDVRLMPEARLVGTVVLEGDESPVPFALVTAQESGERVGVVSADERGRFEFSKIAPGAYRLEARSRSMKSRTLVSAAVVASVVTDVTVPVEARVRVAGRVDSGGAPVKATTVNIGFAFMHEWATSTKTDDDGRFVIEDAPTGNPLVSVEDYQVLTPRTLRVPSEGVNEVIVAVASKGELSVTVTRRGEEVHDATVSVRSSVASASKRTRAGVALFRGLADGKYRLAVDHDNDFAVRDDVMVAAASPAAITVELTSGRQIAGKVVDERGNAVDGARVSLSKVGSAEEVNASGITGADGTFRGGPLRGPATYRLTATRSGAPLENLGDVPTVTVPAAGPPVPASVVLRVKAQDKELFGRVIDGEGGPMRDVRILLSRPERHSDILATTFTGNDGGFQLRNLGSGPFSVRAIAPSGSQAEVKPISLPSDRVTITLAPVGSLRGTLKGFSKTPSVMAWSILGYRGWEEIHTAVIRGAEFSIAGLPKGRFHVAAATAEASASATVDIDGVSVAVVDLVASGSRVVRGQALDLVANTPLSNLRCQAAPWIEGSRSLVVVPGNVFTDAAGRFEFPSAPTTDLYMWCDSDARFRGGVARIPKDLGERGVALWGLDVTGKPPVDVSSLGFGFSDDHPLSRLVAHVATKGAAERAGMKVGDVVERVGDRPMTEVGNGTTHHFMALLLLEQRALPVTVTRGGATVPLTFALDR